MAYCDAFARLVLRLAKNNNVSIPDEIGVIGVDNDPMITENTHPKLSSIAIDLDSAGYKAAQMLAKMLTKKTGEKVHVEPSSEYYGITSVAERESTPVSIVSDRRVGKALDFIRNHFRRTVHEEIINMRLTEVRRLLLKTNERIIDITYGCGFGTPNNLKCLFKKRFGINMREYRNTARSEEMFA